MLCNAEINMATSLYSKDDQTRNRIRTSESLTKIDNTPELPDSDKRRRSVSYRPYRPQRGYQKLKLRPSKPEMDICQLRQQTGR